MYVIEPDEHRFISIPDFYNSIEVEKSEFLGQLLTRSVYNPQAIGLAADFT